MTRPMWINMAKSRDPNDQRAADTLDPPDHGIIAEVARLLAHAAIPAVSRDAR
jgi:hypothetical protein